MKEYVYIPKVDYKVTGYDEVYRAKTQRYLDADIRLTYIEFKGLIMFDQDIDGYCFSLSYIFIIKGY